MKAKEHMCAGLPEAYCFDENQETVDLYLTKAAVWIDVLEHGTPEERALFMEGKGEDFPDWVKNYVFGIINEKLEEYATPISKRRIHEGYRDVFLNEVRISVWDVFYKFNNPKYRDGNTDTRFSTFVGNYIKHAAWQVYLQELEISDTGLRNLKKVKRAEERISQESGRDHEAIEESEIRELLLEENKGIPLQNIRQIRNMMLPVTEIPENYAVFDTEDGRDEETDQYVKEVLLEFTGSLSSLQLFIFLQKFGFCPKRYARLSASDLAKDASFLKLVRNDEHARKRLRSLQNKNAGVYLKKKYIFNMRLAVFSCFKELIEIYEIKPYMLRTNITEVFHAEWNRLALMYDL